MKEIEPAVVSAEKLDRDLFGLALDGRAEHVVKREDIKGILTQLGANSLGLPYEVHHMEIGGELWAIETHIAIWNDQVMLQIYVATPEFLAREFTDYPDDFESCEFTHATNFAIQWIGTKKLRIVRTYDPMQGSTTLIFKDLNDKYELLIKTMLR